MTGVQTCALPIYPEEFQKISKILSIKNRIKKARLVIDKNKMAIKKHYDHLNVAKQLLDHITLDFNKAKQLNF